MKCLDASGREKLLDLIVEARLVEIVYARVEPNSGSIYCTIQRRKIEHGNPSRTTDPARIAPHDPGELFSE
jgi:hypothetical protein